MGRFAKHLCNTGAHFYSAATEDDSVEKAWATETDRPRSLTFKDATKCHACVIHHSCSHRQSCSALYSTYCQCIIQQFVVSACSLNGSERSLAHGAPLASQLRDACACVRQSFATIKHKHYSGAPLGSLLQFYCFTSEGFTKGLFYSSSHMCKQTPKQEGNSHLTPAVSAVSWCWSS